MAAVNLEANLDTHELRQRLIAMRETENGIDSLLHDIQEYNVEQNVSELADIANGSDIDAACEAIVILSQIDHKRSQEVLASALDSPHADVRRVSCEEIACLRSNVYPDLEQKLLDLLETENIESVRYEAVAAISAIGSKASIPSLESIILHDKSIDYEGRPIAELAANAITEIQRREL